MLVKKGTLFDIATNASVVWRLCDKNSSVLEDTVIALWKGSLNLCTTLDTNYQMKTNFNMATSLFDMLLVTMLSNASEQLSNRDYEHFEELLLSYKKAILADRKSS
jgi:hypothetical protein